MRFLILNTDYPEFLRWLYAQYPGLEKQPYEEQTRVRVERPSAFGGRGENVKSCGAGQGGNPARCGAS